MAEGEPEESKAANRSNHKININRAPLFAQEEFYCFVRPKLLIVARDQSDEMADIRSANDVLAKIRPPLTLSTMRKYFKHMQSEEVASDMNSAWKGSDFQKTQEMSDSDTFAFTYLSEYFGERLRKL